MNRCAWGGSNPLMIEYHDAEWGVPLHDEQRLFEFLILEGMQAGLSWSTILNKRENFRRAFAEFDVEQVARFGKRDINRLLQDAGIIRNRLKIEAAINNAQRFIEVQHEFGSFDAYIWGFVDGQPIKNGFTSLQAIPARNAPAGGDRPFAGRVGSVRVAPEPRALGGREHRPGERALIGGVRELRDRLIRQTFRLLRRPAVDGHLGEGREGRAVFDRILRR